MLYTSYLGEHPFAKDPAVEKFNGKYFLYYSIMVRDVLGIGIATSDDLETWTEVGQVPRTQQCEMTGIGAPAAMVREGVLHLFYQTYGTGVQDAICHAWSYDGLHFIKDETNPVYRPTDDWCCGRAIDADICRLGDRYFLYIATRDHDFRIQKIGAAWTPADSDFSRGSWIQACRRAVVTPEMGWEQSCIEAPACVEQDGKIYMFYGGAYNRSPQQIGCAVSADGISFEKLSSQPLIPNGKPGSWNAEESGHPYAFRDEDGQVYLFYQGYDGNTWRISRARVTFQDGMPVIG